MEISIVYGIFQTPIALFCKIIILNTGDDMFSNIENLKLIETRSGISILHGAFTDRPSHVLIFKLQGESRYTFYDKTLHLRAGSVLFIPKGENYTVDALCDGRYCLINFLARLPDVRPMLLSLPDPEQMYPFCSRLEKYRVLDTEADRYRFYALFYEILSCLCQTAQPDYHPSDILARIDPAVTYLKENLFDPALKIGMLHTLCGISDVYFRRLFQARFGVTPKKYVLARRLAHALTILQSGEYNTIAEVAALSGFDDPLYFSRSFRAAYGIAASQVRGQHLP